MKKGLKIALIITIVIAVLFFGYNLLAPRLAQDPATSSPLQSTNTGEPVSSQPVSTTAEQIRADEINQQFINELLNIRSIKLDDEIFSLASFQALQDFSLNLIQPGNQGRDNPFAPFGTESNPNQNPFDQNQQDQNGGGAQIIPIDLSDPFGDQNQFSNS